LGCIGHKPWGGGGGCPPPPPFVQGLNSSVDCTTPTPARVPLNCRAQGSASVRFVSANRATLPDGEDADASACDINAGMPSIFLVRHGEPDGTQIDAEGWRGAVRDLAPLSGKGIEQAKAAGRELRYVGARRIVASPMTRALQTASLIAAETHLPLPDSTLSWRSLSDVQALSSDFEQCQGEWPAGETRLWEPFSSLRSRALGALRRQATGRSEPFIAVCHDMVIQALTGQAHTEPCGIRVLEDVS
jgi:broad specificity phosphatase PhoE